MNRSRIILWGCVFLAMAFLVISCSDSDDDGGSGSGGLTSSLSGDYILCDWGIDDPDHWAGLLAVTFDGSGTLTYTTISDSDDSGDTGTFTYSVSNDRIVTIDGDKSGVMSEDGHIFTIVDTDGMYGDLSSKIAVKKSSGMSTSDLAGDYILCDMGYNDPDHWTGLLAVTFDGSGTLTYTTISDSENSNDTGTYTYSVADDGVVSLGGVASGILSEDGNILALVDTDATNGDLSFKVAVKKSSGMGDSDLSGSYVLTDWGYDDPDHWSGLIDITADGSGTIAYSIISDSDNSSDSGTANISIASDGILSLEGAQAGVMNADGDFFVFVDTSTPDLSIKIAIKKGS